MMKLGPNQQTWVNSLRSGEYKQCNSLLQFGDSYCCLGVGCVVAEEHVSLLFDDRDELDGFSLDDQLEVKGWLGLHFVDGAVVPETPRERTRSAIQYLKTLVEDPEEIDDYGTGQLTLTSLNDDYGLPFEKIADMIEKFPDLYFLGSK